MKAAHHRAMAAALVALIAASTAAAEADNAVGLYGALRDGGSFVDSASNRKLRVDSSAAFAVSLDLGIDAARQYQFFASRQSSYLRLDAATPASATAPPPERLGLTITYLHVGGTNFFDGPIGRGPYAVGGLGVTLMQPAESSYSSELRPSMNLGIGYQLPLAERIALRFEARGYFTLVNSSGGLFCSGGCVLSIKGDGFTQGEVQLGILARF